MKHLTMLALSIAFATATAAPVLAMPVGGSTFVTTKNESDSAVWITAYDVLTKSHAWCVPAHQNDTHGVKIVIVMVRAELSVHKPCQAHPVTMNMIQMTSYLPSVRFPDYRFTGLVGHDRDGYFFTVQSR